MREPWYRKFNQTWYLTLDNGKQLNLGKSKARAFAKWHDIARQGEPAEMLLEDVVKLYQESLADCSPATRDVAHRHLQDFMKHVGRIKVSKLTPYHWTQYIRTKRWASSTARTALNKICAALNYAVDQRKIISHQFHIPKNQKPRMERRDVVLRQEDQAVLERAAYPALRSILEGLRESGCRPVSGR